MSSSVPTCRWGIVSTGLISSWFVADLVLDRTDAKARHVIQCVGSSSLDKGQKFAATHCPNASPTIYASYEEVYADSAVDCVYVGTPHSFPSRNASMPLPRARMSCVKRLSPSTPARPSSSWRPPRRKASTSTRQCGCGIDRWCLISLRKLLYQDKAIGDVFRMSSDFYMCLDIPSLPSTSRYRDLNLGAGTLLDIGIYPLTWAFLTLDPNTPADSERPTIHAIQSDEDGVEVTSSVMLQYPSTGRQAVLTSTSMARSFSDVVRRVEGSEGYIDVKGDAPSHPTSFTVYRRNRGERSYAEGKKHDYAQAAQGVTYEADNTALDLAAGRKQSAIMPWRETIRVMEIMDEIRRQGGTRYPEDH